MNLLAVLEGILFVVGDEGLTLEQAESVLDVNREKLAHLITELQDEYRKPNHGIKIEVLGNTLKLVTKKEHKEYYQKLIEEDSSHLSEAALETLAIVAYNEPITRVKVDEIRGVSSSHIVRRLVAKELIKDLGRSDLPGRPTLFGTTSKFLDYFGLASKDELPKIEEQEEFSEDVDLFTSRYSEKEFVEN
jgi:segregation and condensation protein B